MRVVNMGAQTNKTLALPQSAIGTIFTVAGGRIVVTSLTGVVSTAVGAVAVTVSLGFTPAGGSSVPAAIGSVSSALTSAAVGSQLWLNSTVAGAVQSSTIPTISVDQPYNLVIPAGAITWTTAASTTGAVTWSLTYIVLDDAASVS